MAIGKCRSPTLPMAPAVDDGCPLLKRIGPATQLDDLVALGSSPLAAAFIEAAVVVTGLNVLLPGRTQAGNPTSRHDHLGRLRPRPVAAAEGQGRGIGDVSGGGRQSGK
jgi:hypothetical protein